MLELTTLPPTCADWLKIQEASGDYPGCAGIYFITYQRKNLGTRVPTHRIRPLSLALAEEIRVQSRAIFV